MLYLGDIGYCVLDGLGGGIFEEGDGYDVLSGYSLLEVFDGVVGYELSFVDDDYAVAELLDFLHDVCTEDDGFFLS